MIGVLIGAILFGKFSDSIGRRPAMLISLTVCIASGIPIVFVPGRLISLNFALNPIPDPIVTFLLVSPAGYWIIFVLRAINGAGTVGAMVVGFVITAEIFEPKSRVLVVQFVQALFGVGQAIMALMAYYIPTWRGLSIAFVIPPIFILILFWFVLDESARWLITKRRHDEAIPILRKMARENKRVFSCHTVQIRDGIMFLEFGRRSSE